MRRLAMPRLCLLAAIVTIAGCSSNNKGKIEGTKWTSVASTVKGQALPEGALALEFKANGGLAYRAGPMTFTGTYALGSGDSVTLKLDQDLAGRKTHVQRVVINGDSLTMIDSDGTQMTFSKDR